MFSHMNIRKILVICMVLFCALSGIFAMSADDMIEKAIQNSVTIKTLELGRENSIISRKIDDAEEGVSVTVSSGNVTFQKEKTTISGTTPFFSMGPSVEVALPEKDDTTVSFKLENNSYFYTDGEYKTSLTPSANYKQTISLDSFTDTRKDVTKKIAQVREDLSYQKSLLQFRNTVLQRILSILKLQSSILDQEVTYKRLVADYDTDIASGNITKEGLKDLQARMKIENARVSLESTKTKLESSLKQFRDDYGFDFETPDSVRSASLSFEESRSGNTSVLLAELSLNLANQEVEVAQGTSNKLQLGAGAGVPVTWSKGNGTDSSIYANLSAAVTGSNYSVGATARLDYDFADNLDPSITIVGTWHNKTTATTDDLNLQTLKNKVVLAQIDYDDAVLSYRNSCSDLRTSISDYITELEQFEVSADYDKKILERVKQMYSLGLVTERDVEDAQNNVDADDIKRTTLAINALIIENNIAINQL